VCVGQVQGDGLERDVRKHGVHLLSLVEEGGREGGRERVQTSLKVGTNFILITHTDTCIHLQGHQFQ
jgi:hypothetical protein